MTRVFGNLTPSQKRIAELASSGMTNEEISTALGLAPQTVKNQLSAAYKRTGSKNRTALSRLIWNSTPGIPRAGQGEGASE